MANYAESVLAKGQAVVQGRYNQPEQRRKMPTALALALKNQEFGIPDANALRTSPLRAVEIYFMSDVAQGAGTAKAHNHTGSKGDTAKTAVTYYTVVETFSLPRKQADNNIVSYQTMFNNRYEMAWKNAIKRQDDHSLAYLYANRLQLSAATVNAQIASAMGGGPWNDTNYALEIPEAKANLFMQKAKSVMRARKMEFGSGFDVLADLQLADEFEYAMNQGAGNAANTSFQFGEANVARTQDVIDAAYTNGAMLIMPARTFAGFSYNEQLNKRGVNEGSEVGLLGTISDPFGLGAVGDISMYTERANTSADGTGGSTQDILDQYEITLTMGYVHAPLTTANDSVIMEVVRGA